MDCVDQDCGMFLNFLRDLIPSHLSEGDAGNFLSGLNKRRPALRDQPFIAVTRE